MVFFSLFLFLSFCIISQVLSKAYSTRTEVPLKSGFSDMHLVGFNFSLLLISQSGLVGSDVILKTC